MEYNKQLHETIYEKLNIGDKVFSTVSGWGTVIKLEIYKSPFDKLSDRTIGVEFEFWNHKNKFSRYFNEYGFYMGNDMFPEIYLTPPNFENK